MKALAALVLLPGIAFAEPGEVTTELMNQPASMFDVGMIRLHNHLTTWAKDQAQSYWKHRTDSKSKINVNVRYAMKEGRIGVSLSVRAPELSVAQATTGCEKALEPFYISISKFGASFFQSRASQHGRDDFNRLRKGILEMIDLSCRVYGDSSDDVVYKKLVTWQCVEDRCAAHDVEDQ